MIRKLYALFILAYMPMVLSEARAVISAAAPTGRPAAMGRAPTMPGIGISAGIMSGGSISGGTTGAGDSRCATPLPSEITLSRCTQKYMACLRQDTVCGEHFELCDTKNRFNQKRVSCYDRLLECPDDGISTIYGTKITSTKAYATCDGERALVGRTFSPALNTLEFAANSIIDTEMKDGASYVVSNAYQACQSAADGCIKRACQGNASKCLASEDFISCVDDDNDTTTPCANVVALLDKTTTRISPTMVKKYAENLLFNDAAAKAHIRGACEMEIGGNKACYIISEGEVPKNDFWQTDSFETKMVYENVMTGAALGAGRLSANKTKIMEWFAADVAKAVDGCKTTARNCVTSACGSGSIAACYGAALDNGAITAAKLSENIGSRCKAIVNADQNCKDLFVEKGSEGTTGKVWNRLWGTSEGNYNDTGSLGLAHMLVSELANMFNDNTVRNMFTQCRGEAEACVRRECGTGFKSCYVNDVWKSAEVANANYGSSVMDGYGSASAMENAVGGFDSTMAKSLCLLPIKRSQTCQNYFDIEYAKNPPADGYSWGGSWGNMGSALGGAGSGWSSTEWGTSTNANKANVKMCSALNNYYEEFTRTKNDDGTFTDTNSNVYTGSAATNAGRCMAQEDNIFSELIADIAQTARAQLTKEQNQLKNTCETHRGQTSLSDMYMWAKKPAPTEENPTGVPNTYGTMGLGSSGTPTADLWGAFCQVKVTMTSTDPMLSRFFQGGTITVPTGDVIKKNNSGGFDVFASLFNADSGATSETAEVGMASKASAYFSLGDVISCGSWLNQADLDKIELAIRLEEAKKVNDNRGAFSQWGSTLLGGVLGGGALGTAGFFGGNAIDKAKHEKEQKSALGTEDVEKYMETIRNCRNQVNANINIMNTYGSGNWEADGTSADCTFPGVRGLANASDTIAIFKIKGKLGAVPINDGVAAAVAAGEAVVIAAASVTTSGTVSDNIAGIKSKMETSIATQATDSLKTAARKAKDYIADYMSSNLTMSIVDFNAKANGDLKTEAGRRAGSAVMSGTTVVDTNWGSATVAPAAEGEGALAKLDAAEAAINGTPEKSAENDSHFWRNTLAIGGAVVGTFGGATMANAIAERQHELDMLKAGDDAVKAWFNNVGSKIQCNVGGKVVGTYGAAIELK